MNQDNATGLDRNIGSGAHGDPDVGCRQCRSIVDPVTNKGHLAILLQGLDVFGLFVWQDVGNDLVDADFLGNRVGYPFVVPRQHDSLQAPCLQVSNCLRRTWFWRILDGNQADHLLG